VNQAFPQADANKPPRFVGKVEEKKNVKPTLPPPLISNERVKQVSL